MMTSNGVDQENSWVVPFRTSGVQRPLFFACAGGGDVFEYRDLALALPEDQPVYAFGLPPLEKGIQFPTVEHLAAVYVRKVRELQEHGPYRLCGHSFGGLVVFDMAILLEKEEEEVELLALLDALHPAHRQNLPRKQKINFQLIYLRNRLARYGRNLFTGRMDKMASDILGYILTKVKRFFWKNVGLISSRLGRMIPNSIRTDAMVLSVAWHAYVPGEYNGRVLLCTASERPPEYGIDPTLGWKTCATGVLKICDVPGDHYSMLHPPHVQVLAERLTSSLDHMSA
jgi:thioesterase domain-containing protein